MKYEVPVLYDLQGNPSVAHGAGVACSTVGNIATGFCTSTGQSADETCGAGNVAGNISQGYSCVTSGSTAVYGWCDGTGGSAKYYSP